MSTEEFVGFSDAQQAEDEREIAARYGERELNESRRRWASYSPERRRAIMVEGGAIYRAIAEAMPLGAEHPQVQALIARWHQHIRCFYEPTRVVLVGLAEGYAADPRFAAFFDRIHPELAAFMGAAVRYYCDRL